jgi:pyruvate/2-oxoglutarate dehydrogenase complex dihydrolipoamide dehydrogenase (E3) component
MTDPAPGTDRGLDVAGHIEPDDRYNRELLANVHPPDWENPEPADRYHLVVVGAGTAGLVSAAGAAGLGARVALVERNLMGGDCLNTGCVPSKALIRAARAWHEARRAAKEFGGPPTSQTGDFRRVMERMRALRAGISKHDSASRFRDLGVDVFIGNGRFVAGDALEVAGSRLLFRRAVIATGARPVAPPIPGLEEAGFLTNETLFNLTELPESLGIIGAGPIGCEMAQTFARFGSRVTLFDIAPHVLPREDVEAAQCVQHVLAEDGVDLRLEALIDRVELSSGGRTVRFERDDKLHQVEVEQLLVSVGRAPNVEELGLEAAGVGYDHFGVHVDDRLRTANPRILAVGDVASRFHFTHMADALARIAIQNALFFGRAKASDLVVPWCTYTQPEVARVGLAEHEAMGLDIEVETHTIPLDTVDRSLLEGSTEGFLKVLVQPGKDEILGATLVADHAGDMISELTLAMTHGIGLGKIATTIHPYPTQAEVIKKAADGWRRGKLTPTVKKAFDLFFRVFR